MIGEDMTETLEYDHDYMLEQLGEHMRYSLFHTQSLLSMYRRTGDRENEAKILLLLARLDQAYAVWGEL